MDLLYRASDYLKQLLKQSLRYALIPTFLSVAILIVIYIQYPSSWDVAFIVLATTAYIILRMYQYFTDLVKRQARNQTKNFSVPAWCRNLAIIVSLVGPLLILLIFQLDATRAPVQPLVNVKFTFLTLFGVVKANFGYWTLVKKIVVDKDWQKIKQEQSLLKYS